MKHIFSQFSIEQYRTWPCIEFPKVILKLDHPPALWAGDISPLCVQPRQQTSQLATTLGNECAGSHPSNAMGSRDEATSLPHWLLVLHDVHDPDLVTHLQCFIDRVAEHELI